jgi:arylsulfatase
VLLIVADDLGFSDLGAFGGEIATPNLDRLAYEGLRLTEFHVSPTCSPTRAMLLTGTDNHRAGLGNMGELITPEQRGKPGYEGHLTASVVTLAERLRAVGYQTVMSGKWHLGVEPDQDPSRRGFERTFALLEAGHNHFGRPNLPPPELGGVHYTENGVPAKLPADFYSSDYFTDRMLGYLREADPKRPFFAYLPYSAPHWPLQAAKQMIERYRGRYDDGWEALHRARLERQARLGVLAPGADLAAPSTLLDWDALDPETKRRRAHAMEIYAAMVERMDWNIGRVVDLLRASGRLDDTVVIFLSDNGAAPDNVAGQLAKLAHVKVEDVSYEAMGTVDSLDSYGPQWAQAATAPRRLYKSVTSEGGLIAPAIVHYPRFARQAAIDRTFVTVMDVTPTVLELAHAAASGDRYQDKPVEAIRGRSLVPFLSGASSQVHPADAVFAWELFGQRAVRQGSWKALYLSPPNGPGRWELFDLASDPGERRDLATAHPARLRELESHWAEYAREMRIVPVEQVVSPYDIP